MKKFILFMAVYIAAIGQASAQVITVDDVIIPQGEQQQVQVLYSLDKEDAYVGYGFVFNLPDGITTVKDEDGYAIYELDDSNNKFNVTVSTTDGFGALPKNETVTLNGTEGILLTLTLQADANLEVGTTHIVGLSSIMLTEKDGDLQTSVPLSDITFTVTIAEPTDKHIILDETSTTAPDAATGVDVRVLRTIKAGEWSTICLPFAMTAEQVTAAFGSDVELGDFNGYDVADDGNTINVKFNAATAIKANHPYIIKVGTGVTEFTVDGVDIDPQEAEINLGTSRKPKAFVGNYVAGTAIGNGCLFLNNNKFWYSVGTTKIKAFRAYFDFNDLLPDFEDNYAEARVFIMFDDGETTGINEMRNEEGEMRNVYNLNGQRVSQPARGLYIVNGKKAVIK